VRPKKNANKNQRPQEGRMVKPTSPPRGTKPPNPLQVVIGHLKPCYLQSPTPEVEKPDKLMRFQGKKMRRWK